MSSRKEISSLHTLVRIKSKSVSSNVLPRPRLDGICSKGTIANQIQNETLQIFSLTLSYHHQSMAQYSYTIKYISPMIVLVELNPLIAIEEYNG